MKEDSRGVMAGLEATYIERTGVKSLKVRHNNILGFYIEVTQANAKPLLEGKLAGEFRHRQTMANAVRFSTPELIETEGRIASATERALSLEQEVFTELSEAVQREERGLSEIAAALAELDATAGLAELARYESYTRPVVDDSETFDPAPAMRPRSLPPRGDASGRSTPRDGPARRSTSGPRCPLRPGDAGSANRHVRPGPC